MRNWSLRRRVLVLVIGLLVVITQLAFNRIGSVTRPDGGRLPWTELAALPPDLQTHIIQPGETLNSIAAAYGITVEELVRANELPNPNIIYVGQMLIIPEPRPVAQQPNTGLLPADQGTLYTVQPGDTMAEISARFGLPAEVLAAANDIANPNRLYAGQILLLPHDLLEGGVTVVEAPRRPSNAAAAPPPTELPPPVVNTAGPPEQTPAPNVAEPSAPSLAPADLNRLQPADEVYAVQSGDTLLAIAFAYDVDLEVLVAANNLNDPNLLLIGQELLVSGPTLEQIAFELAGGARAGTTAGGEDQPADTGLR
ncbi:MAG: LysM peptidoglycan-binding domain-containing protein [Candidatus Promineifilaceae bacterium]|nr:LysM peptidoglycan-binding domain-containing protein [Candidatus Promineifilaceae bacterium]